MARRLWLCALVTALGFTLAVDAADPERRKKKRGKPTVFNVSASLDEIAGRRPDAAKPLWSAPLENHLIADMRVAREVVVVELVRYDNSARRVGWRAFDRTTGAEAWRFPKAPDGVDRALLQVTDGTFIFNEVSDQLRRWVAIDSASGAERWVHHSSVPLQAWQLDDRDGRLYAMVGRLGRIDVTRMDSVTGRTEWSTPLPADCPSSGARVFTRPDGLYVFGCAVCRLRPDSGTPSWCRKDVAIEHGSPAPVFTDDGLIVVARDGNTLRLRSENGETVFQVPTPAGATNLFVNGETLYVRGTTPGAGVSSYLERRDLSSGLPKWRTDLPRPLVSNMAETLGSVVGASTERLYGFDIATGEILFRTKIPATGASFPIHIRFVGQRAVVIGEHAVVAYDADDGDQIYFAGVTPVAVGASLDNLDRSILNLQANANWLKGTNASTVPIDAANYYTQQARLQQEQANAYHRAANTNFAEYQRTGDSRQYIAAQGAVNQANIASAFSKASSSVSMFFSTAAMFGAAQDLSRRRWASMKEGLARRQVVLRDSILASYPGMEDDREAFRPHLDGDFLSVAVVDLETGSTSRTLLSPQYREYGTWMRRVGNHLYFQGIGFQVPYAEDADALAYERWSVVPGRLMAVDMTTLGEGGESQP